MSAITRRARLELWLTGVWYRGNPAGFWAGLGLSALTVLHHLYRRWAGLQTRSLAARVPYTQGPLVVVVGNLIAGGAGKTPLVLGLAHTLTSKGYRVGLLSRGYGRSGQAVAVLSTMDEPPHQLSQTCGDEPVYLHQMSGCPVAVGRDRTAALAALLGEFPRLNVVISDDGLQHHRLKRHVEWLAFDARAAGNRRLLPAGPLREPLERANAVDAIVCSNCEPAHIAQQTGLPPDNRWHAVTVRLSGFVQASSGLTMTVEQAIAQWSTSTVAAFTGLAEPDKLFASLRQAGLNLTHTTALPDHAQYPIDFCESLLGQVLITTGKDAVKLNTDDPRLWVAEIAVQLPQALINPIEDQLGPPTD